MPFFTKNQVRDAAARHFNFSVGVLTESLASTSLQREAKELPLNFSQTPVLLFDIFLSHSHLDSILVAGIYGLLTSRGYSVYLDSICDPNLRPNAVNKSTARVLRYRIAQCKSLFACTTENTPLSRWVPWELGFADGWKDGKVAILPIVDEQDFAGQEYFEIYPTVKDAGGPAVKPNDLDIWDGSSRIGSWGTWVFGGRRW
jgi:hypothetical protein